MPAISPIHATPYVPGIARGRLSRQPLAGSIWLADQTELRNLAGTPAGAIVVDAAPFSHAMIGLLSRGVPTVMLHRTQLSFLQEGDEVLLDGSSGRILPGDTRLDSVTPEPPIPTLALRTADGVAVELRASVRGADSARRARERGAAAIGLLRSEFLMPEDGRAPDAEYYEQAFRTICVAAAPLPVTIRLIDLAADKRAAWMGATAELAGPLGLQGSRLFDLPPVADVFRSQLEAIARVQREHRLRVLVPYVVSLDEVKHWRTEIAARLPKPLLIGMMAETPAAALEIAAFCDVADFVALGTNDLMQCLFAADRDQPLIAPLLDAYAPVLYRFLRHVAMAAGPQLIRVQVCGVLSQLPGGLPLLLGLGYRVFSVDPVFVPYLAAQVVRTDTTQVRELAEAACAATSAAEIKQLLARQHVVDTADML